MNAIRLASILAVAGLALAGCFPSGTREAQSFYVLEPAGTATRAQAMRKDALVVEATTASPFYDTANIVFSRAPGTRGFYQFASFTQPPAATIGARLAARLEQSEAFGTVVLGGRAGKGALRLDTHLEEIYHDAAQPPGMARVVLDAVLSDPAAGTVIARRTFTQTAPAPSYDAQGAVQAFNAAVGSLIGEVAAWVDREAPR